MKEMAEIIFKHDGREGIKEWIKGLSGSEDPAGIETMTDLVVEFLMWR